MSSHLVNTEHTIEFGDGRKFPVGIEAMVLEGNPGGWDDPGSCHEITWWLVRYRGVNITRGIDRSKAGLLVGPLEEAVMEQFESDGIEPDREVE